LRERDERELSLCFLGSAAKSRSVSRGNSLELVTTEGERQDSDVDSAGSKAVEKDWRDLLDHSQSNLGKFARESGQARRKEIGGNGGNDADGDKTADELFAFDDVPFGGFQFAKDGVGARQKRLAKLGKPDGAAEAVEEPRAEFSSSSLRSAGKADGWDT